MIVFHDLDVWNTSERSIPDAPVESLESYPPWFEKTSQISTRCVGMSEDLQTRSKGDGRGGRNRLQSAARKSSKFKICCVYESPRSTDSVGALASKLPDDSLHSFLKTPRHGVLFIEAMNPFTPLPRHPLGVFSFESIREEIKKGFLQAYSYYNDNSPELSKRLLPHSEM